MADHATVRVPVWDPEKREHATVVLDWSSANRSALPTIDIPEGLDHGSVVEELIEEGMVVPEIEQSDDPDLAQDPTTLAFLAGLCLGARRQF